MADNKSKGAGGKPEKIEKSVGSTQRITNSKFEVTDTLKPRRPKAPADSPSKDEADGNG